MLYFFLLLIQSCTCWLSEIKCLFNQMVSSEECFTLDEEWKQLEESVLSHVVRIHNQIFGSSDLIQTVSL